MKDPREKELHLKAKDSNNDSSNSSENEFYEERGPVWDRKIVKLFTDTVPQEVIACEVVTNNGNSLIIACVYSSPNSTAYNTNSLYRTFRALAERYYLNLVVLGDFNYPKMIGLIVQQQLTLMIQTSRFLKQSETVSCNST